MTSDETKDEAAARDAELSRLSGRERVTLAVLGVLALAALGVLNWQRRPPPLMLAGAPVPPVAAAVPTPTPAARWDAAVEAAREVDVNAADVAELERLPGVGPVMAMRIVEERECCGPFRSAEDLQRVRGIGPKISEQLKDYITTE